MVEGGTVRNNARLQAEKEKQAEANLLAAFIKYIEVTENIFSPIAYKIDTKNNKRYELTILISEIE